ncbi:hypothetical protein F4818DRAFT_53022 [Hypoxylon cercidicola]|nr:hypothetical protein F4818DRAFT_53022 [Hypoxylon cercidicola]
MDPNKTEAMDSLGDLREMFRGDEVSQNLRFDYQFPPVYRPQTIPGIPADDMVDSSGLEALLVVIRRLCSHLRGPFRDAKLDDTIRDQELINPLLRLAMSDFSKTDNSIHIAMYHALKAFYPDGTLRGKNLSFDGLAEHKLMRTTLWQRAPFLRFNPKTVIEEQGKASLATVNLNPITRWSLLKFQNGDLGQALSADSSWRESPNGERYAAHHSDPAIIRVRYAVDAADPKRFEDLRRVTVDQKRMMAEVTPTGLGRYGWSDPGSYLMTYSLLAAVRLAADPMNAKLKDTVRTYTLDGHSIPAVGPPAMRWDETLGQPDAVYYLYYGLSPPVIAPEPTPHIEIRAMPNLSMAAKIEKALENDEEEPAQSPSMFGDQGQEHSRISSRDNRDDKADRRSGYQSRDSRRDRSPEGRRSKYFHPPRDDDRDDRGRGSHSDRRSYRDRGYGPLPEYDSTRHPDRRSNRRSHPTPDRDRHSGNRGSREFGNSAQDGRGRGDSNRGSGRESGSDRRQVLPIYPAVPHHPPPAPSPPPRTNSRRVANRDPGRDQDTKESRIQKSGR